MQSYNNSTYQMTQKTKKSPICIQYMGKSVELGYSWQQSDVKLASALRLCLMEQLRLDIPISQQQRKEAMKKYYQAMKKQ